MALDMKLPNTLDEAYTDVVQRIKASGESTMCIAFRTYSWLRHATRPLKAPELCQAVLIDASKSDSQWLSLKDFPVCEILTNIISTYLQELSNTRRKQRRGSVCPLHV